MYPFLNGVDLEEHVHVQLWFEDAAGSGFGPGIIQLLSLVHELGSLNKAAKFLGMSYRAAWGKLKKIEEIMGTSLVETSTKRNGHKLSAEAIQLVQSFQHWQLQVHKYAVQEARQLFVTKQ